MSETKMPAVEAENVTEAREIASYEFAFHVLPTVAEGEVATVFQKLKDIITKHEGAISSEEAPARFDLAYEIVKYLEGRNRKFTSAYFGWVRFSVTPDQIESITEEIGGVKELLRHLLVKLTKTEEAHPFFFHEALAELNIKAVDIDVSTEEEKEVDDSEDDETDESDDEESTEDGEESKDKV